MQKHLSWIFWAMAALVVGILICVAYIVYALRFQPPHAVQISGAEWVREAIAHASLV